MKFQKTFSNILKYNFLKSDKNLKTYIPGYRERVITLKGRTSVHVHHKDNNTDFKANLLTKCLVLSFSTPPPHPLRPIRQFIESFTILTACDNSGVWKISTLNRRTLKVGRVVPSYIKTLIICL